MPTILDDLHIDEIALCEEPANPHSIVTLHKSVDKAETVTERVLAAAQALVEKDPTLSLSAALGRVFASTRGSYAAYLQEVATGQSTPLPTQADAPGPATKRALESAGVSKSDAREVWLKKLGAAFASDPELFDQYRAESFTRRRE